MKIMTSQSPRAYREVIFWHALRLSHGTNLASIRDTVFVQYLFIEFDAEGVGDEDSAVVQRGEIFDEFAH